MRRGAVGWMACPWRGAMDSVSTPIARGADHPREDLSRWSLIGDCPHVRTGDLPSSLTERPLALRVRKQRAESLCMSSQVRENRHQSGNRLRGRPGGFAYTTTLVSSRKRGSERIGSKSGSRLTKLRYDSSNSKDRARYSSASLVFIAKLQ